MKKFYLLFIAFVFSLPVSFAQIKILFDNTKAETANNADWVIDADSWNLDISPNPTLGGNEANAQQIPTPAQSGITSATTEDYWTGALSAWGVEAVKQGYYVETLPYNGSISYGNSNNPQDLSNYSIFVVCEPNILYTASEKTALLTFVQNGGGLFMIADHDNSDRNGDGYDSPAVWNDFLTNNGIQNNPFGIVFDYEYFTDATNNIPYLPGDPLLHGSYGDVTTTEFYGGTTMTISPSQNASVKGVIYRSGYSNTGNTGVMCAYATYGNGKVVALGDSSPADDGSGDPNDNLYDGWIEDANGAHERLIMNATIWLAEHETEALPQPSNNVTNFSVTASTESSISLSWTDASGGQLPTSYLIKAAPNSSAISNPIDGTAETNSTFTKNVAYGVESISFSSLASSTSYTFKIFPYTNSGADIDYLINTTPEASGTTTEAPNSIFCDDFETDLSNWTITNDIAAGAEVLISSDFGGANGSLQSVLFEAPYGDTDYYTSSIEKTFTNVSQLSVNLSYYFEDYRGGEITIYINNVEQYAIYTDGTGDLLIGSADSDQWKELQLDLSETTSTTGDYTLKIEGISKTSTSWKDRVAIDDVCVYGTQASTDESCDDFEDNLNNWTVTNDASAGAEVSIGNTFGGALGTSNAALFEAPNGADISYYTSSIEKTFYNTQNLVIDFWYYFEDYRGGEITIYVNNVEQYAWYTDGDGDQLITSTDIGQWKQYTLNLASATATTGTYTIKIEGASKTSSTWKDRVAIDEVCVHETQTSVSELPEQINVSLFPNPSNGTFTISLGNATENYLVQVIDVSGKVVYKNQLPAGENKIELPSNTKGIFVLLIDGKTVSKQLKLVVR